MIPHTAAYIWFRDSTVHLCLPSTLEGGHSHSLTFPNDLRGWARIKSILRERERASDLRLALRGSPTQAQVAEYDQKLVRKPKPKFAVAPSVAQAAKEVMRKMGMI